VPLPCKFLPPPSKIHTLGAGLNHVNFRNRSRAIPTKAVERSVTALNGGHCPVQPARRPLWCRMRRDRVLNLPAVSCASSPGGGRILIERPVPRVILLDRPSAPRSAEAASITVGAMKSFENAHALWSGQIASGQKYSGKEGDVGEHRSVGGAVG